MKRLIFALAIVLLLAGVHAPMASAGGEGHGHEKKKLTQHYKDSLFKTTEKGLFSVELRIKGGLLKVGMNSMDIIVHNSADKDVLRAQVTVTPWMPAHGHGVSSYSRIMERGGGLYRASKVEVSMPGKWDLTIGVEAAGALDKAVFSVQAVKPGAD